MRIFQEVEEGVMHLKLSSRSRVGGLRLVGAEMKGIRTLVS